MTENEARETLVMHVRAAVRKSRDRSGIRPAVDAVLDALRTNPELAAAALAGAAPQVGPRGDEA